MVERGEKTPTPKISALLRQQPVLLRANFVLTKDRKRPYYRHFCVVNYTGMGLVVKRTGVLSKVQMLNLVLGVGVFSLLPIFRNTPSTAGNSLTGPERPSPEPILKKEAPPTVLGGERILETLWRPQMP